MAKVAMIIPTLNAAFFLPRLLFMLRGFEVIIIDGGSTDATVALAEAGGAKTIITRAGRGHQMARGAAEASADVQWLFFLHADSQLAQDWQEAVRDFLNADEKPMAVFRFALDDSRWRARIVEFFVWLRCLLFALPYGDQGLLIRRDVYLSAGGFADIALMEDVALIRRFSRRQIHFFRVKLTTSADRFHRRGYVRQITRNLTCLLLYFAGASPERIARIYK